MSSEAMDSIDEDIDNVDIEEESGPLFWSMKLEPGKAQEIDQPAIAGYIVHVTHACYGEKVNKGSRTVVMVNPSADESDKSQQAPIAVLKNNQHENQSLDLLFNESATMSLRGQNPSPVYLTGYIQPPVEPVDSDLMNPMYEDMDEEEIQKALAEQRKQQKALDAEDSVDVEDEEEEAPQLMDEDEVEPPSKKQKTISGAKATKNGSNAEPKKRKSPPQKPQKSPVTKPTDDTKEKEDKKQAKKDKKKGSKSKKMLDMGQGLKYRDMKIGSGDVVKNGDKVRVYYVGQDSSNKVFDKAISGKGFEFNLGKGDVIKGWDLGLKGMKVGGKRKLIVPPKLAYGAEGSPPQIKKNATLTFTIELKGIN